MSSARKEPGFSGGVQNLLRKREEALEPDEGGSAPPDDAGDEGRGDSASQNRQAKKPRRRRGPVEGKTTGRRYYVPDQVHLRLSLYALKRKTNVSAVVTDILDKQLPRLQITEETE